MVNAPMPDQPATMYEFIGANPGYDVLYYHGGDEYHAEPVVAWAVAEYTGSVKAFPITCDVAWSLDDERTIMAPDGSIRAGDLEHWANVKEWLDTMRNRKAGDDSARRDAVNRTNFGLDDPAAPPLSIAPLRERLRLLPRED
jgi:hypothetical protein